MRNASQMDKFALEHGFVYNNKSALKHFEVIQKQLRRDETVLISLAPCGIYNGGAIVMNGICAVAFTDKRLIYAQKGIFGSEPVKIVNLDNVNDVQKDTFGLFDGKVCIDTLKETVRLNFSKLQLDEVYLAIVEVLEVYKRKNEEIVLPVIEELEQWKRLYDRKIITKKEFDEKKKQLLGL
ncbi:MAG: PH domain-containing protein [Clostridia bacterium]|nr:PH domain-containing protein [Clostridia bacterium]